MADINVERKGPSIWPWIIGLLVLALLIWAIAEMVDTDEEVAAVEEVERVEEPVAAVPAPAPVTPEAEAPELSTLLPLGPEDENARATVRGVVVGQPISEGYWVRTEQNEVIFVRTSQPATAGQTVTNTGTIQRLPNGQAETLMSQANLQPETGWRVHREMHLNTMAAEGMQPGVTPQQPGMRPPAGPGDTVRGRY